jgi:hypothetical protein
MVKLAVRTTRLGADIEGSTRIFEIDHPEFEEALKARAYTTISISVVKETKHDK